jgi:hypothetical protein
MPPAVLVTPPTQAFIVTDHDNGFLDRGPVDAIQFETDAKGHALPGRISYLNETTQTSGRHVLAGTLQTTTLRCQRQQFAIPDYITALESTDET